MSNSKSESLIECIITGCKHIQELSEDNNINRDDFKIETKPKSNTKHILLSIKNPKCEQFTTEEQYKIENVNNKIRNKCSNCVQHTKGANLKNESNYRPSTEQLKYIEIQLRI